MGLFKKQKKLKFPKGDPDPELNAHCEAIWNRPSLKRLRRQTIFVTRAIKLEYDLIAEAGVSLGMSASVIGRELAEEIFNDTDSIQDMLKTFESRFKQILEKEKK